MSLGSFLYRYYLRYSKSRLKHFLSLYTAVFGVVEFHSHIRWRAVKRLFYLASEMLKLEQVGD